MTPYVSQIAIYPIKSTAPIFLEHTQVQPEGLSHDRRFMLVDDQGQAITGREQPKLCQLVSQIEGDLLHLMAPRMNAISCQLAPPLTQTKTVTIWGDRVKAYCVSKAIDQWFSRYLETPCHLVFMGKDSYRKSDPQYSQDQDNVSFADGFSVLLANQASLNDLNQRLDQPVAMQRFRANLTIHGLEPFVEDTLKRIKIGVVEFDVVKPCARCVFTTLNPATASFDEAQQPLRTLGHYRRTEAGVMFGQNLIPRNVGFIRLNDTLSVL